MGDAIMTLTRYSKMAGKQLPAVQVLKAVYYSLKTLLGPRKMLKCCFSDEPNEEQLFNDSMQLLRKLVIEHPVYDLLFDMCHSHHKTWGCGTTTLAVLCILWAEEASRLMDQGVPQPCIVFWFRKTLDICKSVTSRNAITIHNIFEHFEAAASGPPLEPIPVTAAVQMPPDATPATKPSPSVPVPSITKRIPWQGRGLCRVVSAPSVTREMSRVSWYSRYSLPSTSTPTNCPIPTNCPAPAHCPTPSNCPAPAHCPTPSNCPTPANYPAPVGNPPHECRHRNALEYLVSALCAGQHWKARDMVVQCMMLQCRGARGARGHGKFESGHILTDRITGPSEELSVALQGMMVVRINSDFVPLVQDLHECSNLRVLTLSGDLAPGYMHKGMKGTRSVTEVILGPDRLLQGERDRWMKDVMTAVKKLSVRLLAVKGFVLRDVVTTCLSHDILVLDQIGMVKLAHLAEECGSEVISYVEQAEEGSVGCIKGVTLMGLRGWERQTVRKKGAKGQHGSTPLYQTALYCSLLLNAPSRVVQVVVCASTPELVGLLEHDFHKCMLRVESAFSSGAMLVRGGGWIEAACMSTLEDEARRGRGLGVEEGEWSSVYGPPWMKPLCSDYRDTVVQGVINGFHSYLTTLAQNVCAEGGKGEVEGFLSKVAEPSVDIPSVLDLVKVKVDTWTKAVDFVGLTTRRM